MTITRSHFRGCVIGQCLGDALGFPVEGRDEARCLRYVTDEMKSWFDGDIPSDAVWSGQYTDDSQLARELMISLIRSGGWSPRDYAMRIANIFHENRIIGRGLACDSAARKLIHGVDWRESGTPAPSAGNGTAMRAAPVGLYVYDQPGELIRIAHEQGWITHHDRRCSAGSIAIAGAIALTLQGKADHRESFLTELADWVSVYHSEFAELILRLNDWIELSPAAAVVDIKNAGKPEGWIDGWPGISPFVVCSVLWSLYSFLRFRDSYYEAISTAISVGGDVDTTGAMTGAISGACLGIEALPEHLTRKLNDVGEWGFEKLIELADKFYDIRQR